MRIEFPLKLVRNKVPTFIEAKGGTCIFRQLKPGQYERALYRKAIEEATEVQNAGTRQQRIEELADLLECVEAIRIMNAIPLQDLDAVRKLKAAKLGTFSEGKMVLFAFGGK